MELQQIEILLDKYFEGQTSISEEKQLKAYFSSNEVAPHLQQYKSLFENLSKQKEVQYTKTFSFPSQKRNYTKWIGIAATFVALAGTLLYFNFNFNSNSNKDENLGTYSNPEEAFVATQNALNMISEEMNKGKEGIAYLNEYEKTKKTIFK